MKRRLRLVGIAGLSVAVMVPLSACSGAAGGGGGGGSAGGGGGSNVVNVLAVNNPQMLDAQKITDAAFTKKTGITVKYTFLPENEERDKATQQVANGASSYDVLNIGPYEVPLWAERKWIEPLDQYVAKDPNYDLNDFIPGVRAALSSQGKLYVAPFATETTFTAYRKDLLKAKGLTMPEHPTWNQVVDIASKVNDPAKGVSGLCMRGLAGWGQNMAQFTDMLNTFGGTWFNKDWSSGVTSPEFKQTMQFYVNAAQKYGPKGQAQVSVSDCFNNFIGGKSAMWIDSSAAGPAIDDPGQSKVAGKVGYAYMPTVKTQYSGWLWSWGWGIPTASKNKDNAWKYISWVTGKTYGDDVAAQLGWGHYAGYSRESTYDKPGFVAANKLSLPVTKGAIAHADPNNPGVQPRPYSGIQYITIPEWTDLGTTAGQQLSAAIGGTTSVDSAIKTIAAAADKVSKAHAGQ